MGCDVRRHALRQRTLQLTGCLLFSNPDTPGFCNRFLGRRDSSLLLMTSPADADSPAPAQRGADFGWGTKIAAGMAGLILIVEFVLPGFLAAGFSRTGHGIFLANGVLWGSTCSTITEPPVLRLERWALTPPDVLMLYLKPVRRFYRWQYRLAGGEERYDPWLPRYLPPGTASDK
jgi:hypothetical protein